MSILDKAKGLLGKNKDKSKGGVDKGAGFADKKTGGAHTEKIDGGADKAKDAIDDLPPQ
ncbi:MAG TPA: antitoxin [Acidimicrobiales bacterium]|nr:antitoxin [Acidimicrobiales bacterium]